VQIRELEITHFRGIKHLKWSIPKDRRFVCVIGPGDSGKSSVLDAIDLTLCDRWNPAIADTDFYDSDVSTPIVIRCVVSDLPKSLLKESSLGLSLSGIDDLGELHQDPEDGTDAALIIQLCVDDTLEPAWTIERVDGSDSTVLRSTHRREFATFKVDDRIDTHLRWTKTSALGRISAPDNSAGTAMALASRAAREAIADLDDENLSALTTRIQAKLNEVGCGVFESIQPGLDTSLSSTGGNLALYESNVPLTNYGLGSKRLAGLVVQQLAAANRAVLLIDEIEHGLEPHRLVRLLQYLKSDDSYSQVFVTTHSPVVVEQAPTENLAILRNDSGDALMRFLPDGTGTTLRMRRSRPSSFLARRVIVTEGRTEEGLLHELIRRKDRERLALGQSVAAGEGTVVQDGEGGSEAPVRARALIELGYAVAVFMDSDDRTVDANVRKAESAGVVVARWAKGHNTESQLAASLDAPGLTSLLLLGVDVRSSESTVVNDLTQAGLPGDIVSLKVEDWIADGSTDLAGARGLISKAMIASKWFKNVDAGNSLGEWILDHQDDFMDSTVCEVIETLQSFIYPDLRPGLEDAAEDE